MPESPPELSAPPIRGEFFSKNNKPTEWWTQWFEQLWRRVGKADGWPIIGDVAVFETTVSQANLASSGTVTLLDARSGEQWKLHDVRLSGGGTNFSGGGGDRLLAISDGTTIWSVIPAATLQSLAFARWGDAGAPPPATGAADTTASAAGTDVTAQYSGGSADYSAGQCTITLLAERVA